MALFNRVCRQLECFTHFLTRRAAQEPEKLPEECEAFTADDRRHKVTLPKKSRHGEREEERGGRHKETLEEIKMKKNGRVCLREKLSLEKLMDGGTELREDGEKERKERKRKTTVLLVEVKPLRSSVLKPIEGEIPMFPHFKLLPPVIKPHTHPQKPVPASEEEFSLIQADHDVSLKRSSSRVCPLKRVPPRPTPAPDELFSLQSSSSRVCSPECPHPFPSSPSPQLVLVNIEDEESEYVEFTGKTFLKRSRKPEAEVKPGKMFAWMEKEEEREVQEEEWASQVEEIPVKWETSRSHKGHSFPDISDPARRKKTPTFYVDQQEKRGEENDQGEGVGRELLLERYRNDPKLKHLRINKHNRNYSSS